jgi:predicted nicotinamide N-methyase
MTGAAGDMRKLETTDNLDVDPLRSFMAGNDVGWEGGDYAVVPSQRAKIVGRRTVRFFADASRPPEQFDGVDVPADVGAPSRDYWDIVVEVDQTEGCGGAVWPAAEVLGAYLASQPAQRAWQGKSVVELGAGTGLVALIAAAVAPGADICATDQAAMLPLLRTNTALNPHLRCTVSQLDWGYPSSLRPDILLLADCVYLEPAFQPLVDTLAALATPQTTILFCYQKRRKADKRFFSLLRRKFTWTDIDDDHPVRTAVYRRQGTRLLRLYKK